MQKLNKGEDVTIVFIGDSTTEQNETTEGKTNHVGVLNTYLEEMYPGQITVVNAGVSGNTVEQIWPRLYKDALRYDPDLIVISSGLNDCNGTLAISPQKYEEIYALMIHEILSQTDSDIVIRTPNPTLDDSFNEKLETYNAIAKAMAQKCKVAFCDCYTELQKISGDNYSELMHDTVHPNALGHERIAETIFL